MQPTLSLARLSAPHPFLMANVRMTSVCTVDRCLYPPTRRDICMNEGIHDERVSDLQKRATQ